MRIIYYNNLDLLLYLIIERRRFMKKSYVAPMIAIEHYELTQAIAACSGMKIGFSDSACVMADDDPTNQFKSLAYEKGYFSDGCSVAPEYGQELTDGYCYHTNASSAFTSG